MKFRKIEFKTTELFGINTRWWPSFVYWLAAFWILWLVGWIVAAAWAVL